MITSTELVTVDSHLKVYLFLLENNIPSKLGKRCGPWDLNEKRYKKIPEVNVFCNLNLNQRIEVGCAIMGCTSREINP